MGNKEDFKLIGAGLGRTGTASLREALGLILPGKCYHMFENQRYDHDYIWLDVLNNNMSDEKFAEFLLSNGYVAGVSFPFNVCFEQAIRAFPNAKVLLSIRDPKEWENSVRNTILFNKKVIQEFPIALYRKLGLFRRYIPWHSFLYANTKIDTFNKMLAAVEEGRGEKFFQNWIEHVKKVVPENKLLVYNISEGWGPLCKFLDVPVPNIPFPRVNQSHEYGNMQYLRRRKAWTLLYEIVSIPILSFMVYYLSK